MNRKEQGKMLAQYGRVRKQDIIDIQAHVIVKLADVLAEHGVPADVIADYGLELVLAVGKDWQEIENLVKESRQQSLDAQINSRISALLF